MWLLRNVEVGDSKGSDEYDYYDYYDSEEVKNKNMTDESPMRRMAKMLPYYLRLYKEAELRCKTLNEGPEAIGFAIQG